MCTSMYELHRQVTVAVHLAERVLELSARAILLKTDLSIASEPTTSF